MLEYDIGLCSHFIVFLQNELFPWKMLGCYSKEKELLGIKS